MIHGAVVWGSAGGAARYVGRLVMNELGRLTTLVRVRLVAADALAVSDLSQLDLLVLIASTWHTGNPEAQLDPRMARLVRRADRVTLLGKVCACVAIEGERDDERTDAADLLERFIGERGGELLVPSLRIVGGLRGQDDAVIDWVRTLTEWLVP